MAEEPLPQSTSPAETPAEPARPTGAARLAAAFARMVGTPAGQATDQTSTNPSPQTTQPDAAETAPGPTVRAIVEGMLFVGRPASTPTDGPDGQPLTADEIAAAIRDVSPDEVAQEIALLNEQYAKDRTPYEIAQTPTGYRMVLKEQYGRLRDRYHGRVRAARLSPSALETLSVIAYRQPVTQHDIDTLRGDRSTSLVRQLVRRGLVERIDLPAKTGPSTAEPATPGNEDSPTSEIASPHWQTTPRFLKLLELENIGQLPQVAEHSD